MQNKENIYKPFYQSLGLCAILVFFVIISFNFLSYNPSFDDVWEEARFDIKHRRFEHAEFITTQYAIAHPDKDIQLLWLNLHFSVEEQRNFVGANAPEGSSRYRADADVYTELEKRMASDDFDVSEKGLWGMAMAKSLDHEFADADQYLKKISDTASQYVLYTKAIFYEEQQKYDSALYYLERAVTMYPDHPSFIRQKIRLLYSMSEKEKLYQYLNQGNLWSYTNASVKEDYYFSHQQWGNYWFEILTHQFRYITFPSLLGALLIALFWGYYLHRLDIYNPDPIGYMALCFVISCLLTYTGWFLYEVFHVYLEADLNGNFWNDLFYSVFTIGIIEEGLKLIPLLIMIFVFKKGNEPYNYIKYACTSALGFAFIENIMYLDMHGIDIMHSRFILAGFGHLFDSCLVGYILAVNKFKWKLPAILIAPPALVMAALSHGLYDFFLISEFTEGFWLISIIIIILSLFLFHGFVNNTLNNSGYYNKEKKFPVIGLVSFAIAGSFVVLSTEYILSTAYLGSSHALVALVRSLLSINGLFVLVFLVTLNSITIVPGGWLNVIHFFRINNNRYSSGFRKGNKVIIHSNTKNEYQQLIFPVRGTVVRTVKTTKGKMHLIQLDQSFPVEAEVKDHVFVRLREEKNVGDNAISVFLINKEAYLRKDHLVMKSLQFIGWAKIEFEVQPEAKKE